MVRKLFNIVLTVLVLGVGISAAQDTTTFTVEVENVSGRALFENFAVFNTPVGADAAGAILPGQAFEFEFPAFMAERLNFAMMFAQSNDLFFALDEEGLMLYDENGDPPEGDITNLVTLWDAGTEVNQALGEGDMQAPRQAAPNSGEVENGVVRPVSELDDGLDYPAVEDIILVTVEQQESTGQGDGDFLVRIENVSGDSDFPTPITPGIWVLHFDPAPFFTRGEPDYGDGLEALAEDGNVAVLAGVYSGADVLTPITPIVWTLHNDPAPFFTVGAAARDNGLEALAEDGNPAPLGADFTIIEVDGPAFPGDTYSFSFEASPGDALSFATMFVESNDLFFAPGEAGIPLFDSDGDPITGDVTNFVTLWDAGTEVNEAPGAGANQPARQSGANTGDDESGIVQPVDDEFDYPVVPSLIRVTISVDD